ncbi:CIC11C00000001901 [Sungouiella intermedia]|uniref:CIC11C00000001901 n=1 Tax=Sungouiella intermedia TaxID=45354 RepID=A0A1L0DL20_9ASCO|nr:CIC11C00000001901 [[Candida] intermedia]
MVKQEPFAVEQFMDKYETNISYNMGETCVDSLSMNDILASLPPQAREDATKALLDTKLTYGHIRGSPRLKKAIASLYNDNQIGPDNIVITNGAIGGNFLTFYTVVNPDDHVLVVDPSYQQLSSVPKMFGAKVEPFELKFEENYLPDLNKLEQVISVNNTKLLVINNPNNPTGCVWENDILALIVNIAKRYNVTILCDEVYRPLFHFEGVEDIKSIVSFGYENTISTGSMSKAFSLAGLRLGWIVTKNAKFLDGFFEKRDYNTISVSILDDAMAAVALENVESILARNHELCQRNLAHIDKFIEASKGLAQWVRPRGGSTCFIRINGVDTMELAEDLAENHATLVVPGEVFGKPGSIRIGFGNSEEGVKLGLEVLLRRLQK